MSARKQDRPLSDRLAVLSDAVPAASRRARECEVAHRGVVAEIARLTDAVTDAYAEGDEARAAKASKERAKLEQGSLREAEERLEGAHLAAAKAEAARGLFAAEHVDGLLAERLPDAVGAAAGAEQALEDLSRAHARWNGVEAEAAALLRLAGRDTRDLPRFPGRLATLVRDARHAGDVSVPPPTPGGLAMVPVPREALPANGASSC